MAITQAIYMPTGAAVEIKTYRGGQWVSVLDNPGKRTPKPPVGPLLNVGTRMCTANGGGRNVDATGSMAATTHTLTVDATELTFEWDISKGMLPVTVGGTYRAAYAVNGGLYKDFTFAGEKTFTLGTTVSGLQTMKADPVAGSFFAGDQITIYSYVLPTAAGQPFGSTSGTAPGEPTAAGEYSTAFGSLRYDGTSSDWAMRPARVLATSDRPSWVVGGDSIMQQNNSYVEQALANLGLPASKTAQGGEAYAHFPERWGVRYERPLTYGKHLVDELGINDMNTSDWRKVAVKAIAHWKMTRSAGVEVLLKTTLTLNVGSTDQWRTLEGQTLNPTIHAARTGFNAWLRDGAPLVDGALAEVGAQGAVRCKVVRPDSSITQGSGEGHPITAIIDPVAAVEEGNTGKYTLAALAEAKSVGTNMDGLHPNAGIHRILAQRVARDIALLGYV